MKGHSTSSSSSTCTGYAGALIIIYSGPCIRLVYTSDINSLKPKHYGMLIRKTLATFSKIKMAPTPGLLYVLSNPNHPKLSEDTYNKWYSDFHIRNVVNSGLADLAIRYKNVTVDSAFHYLCVYRLPDIAKLQDEGLMESIPKTHELLPDGKAWDEVQKTDSKLVELMQKFEGKVPKDGEYRR